MSEMSFRPNRAKKEVTLNITSLIDVLFLLLIFFMLTGTFKRVGELELQLPDSTTSAPAGEEEVRQVELIVTEDGLLFLDGEGTGMPQLKSRLEAVRAEDPAARVMIKAEGGVDHGEVVRLLDIVRDSGFPGVGIGTHIQKIPDEGQ
jgi:biopolymer transport protein ExbD